MEGEDVDFSDMTRDQKTRYNMSETNVSFETVYFLTIQCKKMHIYLACV